MKTFDNPTGDGPAFDRWRDPVASTPAPANRAVPMGLDGWPGSSGNLLDSAYSPDTDTDMPPPGPQSAAGEAMGDFQALLASPPVFSPIDGDADLHINPVAGRAEGGAKRLLAVGLDTLVWAASPGDAVNPVAAPSLRFSLDSNHLLAVGSASNPEAATASLDAVAGFSLNAATASAPVYVGLVGASNPFNGVDVALRSTPSLADIDGDGDLDLVIGEGNGTLQWVQTALQCNAPASRWGSGWPMSQVRCLPVVAFMGPARAGQSKRFW